MIVHALKTRLSALDLSLLNRIYLIVTLTFVYLAVDASAQAINGSSYELKGKVVESGSGEALIGASVVIKGTTIGVATDGNGEFTLRNISEGQQTIVYSYIGFMTKEVSYNFSEDLVNDDVLIELQWQGVEGEEITITAQARGQVAAINDQLQSNTITNVVSKDRIQELPDVNAAESIGRLPGVSLQRSNGEANKIVVRGLSPKYNTVTVNGVRMPSTDTNNRSVDLSLISSGMLDGIEVTKALTPDKDADALGGTVDLKLRNAPEGGWAGNIQVQGGYTALQQTYNNYKAIASVSNRFLQDKVGIIVNFNTDQYNRSADRLNASYSKRPNLSSDEPITIYPTYLNLTENDLIRKRLGGSLVVDLVVPNGKVVYNTFYNKLTNDGFNRQNEMNYSADTHRYRLNEGYNDTDVNAHGFNVEQDFGWVSYDFGISFTKSSSLSPDDNSWTFMEENSSIPVDGNVADTLQIYELQKLFVNDLSNTYLYDLSQTWRQTKENEYGIQLNVKLPFVVGDKINGYVKTGFKIRDLERSNDQNSQGTGNSPYYGGGQEFRRVVSEELPDFGFDPRNRIPMEPFLSSYERDNFLKGNYQLGYTMDASLMRLISEVAIENGFTGWGRQSSHGNDYEGREEFDAYYAMTELQLGKKFVFMPGFRIEREYTDYSAKFSTALSPAAGVPLDQVSYIDTTTTRSDQFFLPMIHAQFKPLEWLNLRLAYTETISRPDFRQFAPITYFNAISQYANAPNKDLRTSRSRNYDASLSVYRNKIGFFTASYFYKEIDDLISSIQFRKVPDQTILPDLEIKEAGQNAITVYSYINNPTPAWVKGIELDWQTNFWYLPSILKGLVLNINYTHLQSEVSIPAFKIQEIPIEPRPRRPPFTEKVLVDTVTVSPLPDQPNDILNLTLGYDFKGFSGRVSLFYQVGSVIGRGSATFDDYDDSFVDDYFRMDVSMKQKLVGGAELFLNLNNVNAEGDLRYQSPIYKYPTNEQLYGFTMDVGLKYSF